VRRRQARENKEMETWRIGLPLCCDSGFCGRIDGLRRATAAYDSASLRETEMRRTQTKINALDHSSSSSSSSIFRLARASLRIELVKSGPRAP
jgi:hypothetical protein